MAVLTPAQVRDYLSITATTGQFSNDLIGSNVSAAAAFLARRTSRQFEWQGSNVSKVFSTEGRAYLTIPGLISATSVTHQGTTLIENETYWLMRDRLQSGVFTGIQIRPYGLRDFRSNSEWFDRGLDLPEAWGRSMTPNDLDITGQWGHIPLPDEFLHAVLVLAGYYTKRPDAVLSGGIQTPEGGIFDLSNLPVEITTFVGEWALRPDSAVSI